MFKAVAGREIVVSLYYLYILQVYGILVFVMTGVLPVITKMLTCLVYYYVEVLSKSSKLLVLKKIINETCTGRINYF